MTDRQVRWRKCSIFTPFILFLSINLSCALAQDAPILTSPTDYSIAIGIGEPNGLQGIRIAAQWDWQQRWFTDSWLSLQGYWDYSLAYWEGDGDNQGRHRAIGIMAFAPFFRLQGTPHLSTHFSPYLQASAGLALTTTNHFGRRDLGKHWLFQDFMGGGMQFGHDLAWDISVHYLHYSNAGFHAPNQGLDVKLVFMLNYHLP